MSITSYPLAWPKHFPRTTPREVSRFHTTISGAMGNVHTSLHRFSRDSRKKIEGVVVSSNVTLGVTRPADPGVAIWFEWDGMQVCIPIDRYTFVEANLQAIHHILEARRVELRHGTLELVRATFQGFLLAAPTGKLWWEVLGVQERASKQEIQAAYRRLASKNHPDKDGSDGIIMAELNAAYEQASHV